MPYTFSLNTLFQTKMQMNTTMKRLHAFFYALAIVLLFPACNGDHPTQEGTAPEVMAVELGGGTENCATAGELRDFPLDIMTSFSNPPGITTQLDYMVELTTYPFRLEENCHCKISHYVLTFDQLPATSQIVLYDANGNALNYDGPFTGPAGGMEIELSEENLNITTYVGFDPPLDPAPNLRAAGGYCIIDNISGPNGTGLVTTPHIVNIFNAETDQWESEIYISAESAQPVP